MRKRVGFAEVWNKLFKIIEFKPVAPFKQSHRGARKFQLKLSLIGSGDHRNKTLSRSHPGFRGVGP